MDNVPLFDLPATAPLPRPVTRHEAVGTVRYANYRPKNAVRCDDCATCLWEANKARTAAPLARQARFTRTQGSLRLYLCSEHKAQRQLEEVPQ